MARRAAGIAADAPRPLPPADGLWPLERALAAGRAECPQVAAATLYCGARSAAGPRPPRSLAGFSSQADHEPRRGSHAKDVILTPEGLEKLKGELELLSTEKRREVAERIKEAREFGDISENSEYDDAKNEQAMLESRIAQLQEKLRMATVIQAKDLSTDVVQVGSVVHVKDEKTGKSAKYTIVGSAEAKPERKQALQRVASRSRADRAQAQRDGRREGSARARPQAEDHQDRRRPRVGSPR